MNEILIKSEHVEQNTFDFDVDERVLECVLKSRTEAHLSVKVKF